MHALMRLSPTKSNVRSFEPRVILVLYGQAIQKFGHKAIVLGEKTLHDNWRGFSMERRSLNGLTTRQGDVESLNPCRCRRTLMASFSAEDRAWLTLRFPKGCRLLLLLGENSSGAGMLLEASRSKRFM
jgi:hypothetical protein